MGHLHSSSIPATDTALTDDKKSKVAAIGGITGALLASTCCIGPLLLVSLGVSGTWIGSLSALKAYQPLFILMAFASLGYGFWLAYRPEVNQCEDGTVCAAPISRTLVKSILWTATLLVALALSVDWWAPLFY